MSGNYYDLERFVEAQDPVFERVCAELREGRKRSHWMWFIFPQLAGLGQSSMAVKFAIASREEAEAYLAHEILGPRLRLCTQLVNDVAGRSISEIFGYPDDLKFHSSMTLFAGVPVENQVFNEALKKYFSGKLDSRTREILKPV
ncbi:MAG TPA: DUF1810 domain-containing protein [Candidatus Acidoferrum sp.]|nr:DUF1810 domain-containing protein [Candidatus Acidoferrum sp.]